MIHPYFSPKCYVGLSPIHDSGIFAHKPLEAGELVCIWAGEPIPCDQVSSQAMYSLLQIHEDFLFGYLSPEEQGLHPVYKLNHCCTPNIGVQGNIVFVARRAIAVGEELCFDYETTETAYPGWSFSCKCGSQQCRGLIDGNAWHNNPAFREHNAGYFSAYLQQKIRSLNNQQLRERMTSPRMRSPFDWE